MSTKWLIGFIMLFVICTISSLLIEAQQFGDSQTSHLYILLSPDIPSFWNPIGAAIAYVTVAWNYLQALWDMFWFDYSFFEGSWQLVRFIVFVPISVGLVVSLILAAIRGVSSG